MRVRSLTAMLVFGVAMALVVMGRAPGQQPTEALFVVPLSSLSQGEHWARLNINVAKGASLGGYPAPPSSFQQPTVWQGDHVVSGGNKAWAEEDAALHAYTMQRWRTKQLDEQADQQRSMWDVQNEAQYWDYAAARRGGKVHLVMPSQLRSSPRRQQLFSVMGRSPPSHGTGANDDPFLNLNPPLNPAISSDGHYGEWDPYSDRDPPIYKKSGLAMLKAGSRSRTTLLAQEHASHSPHQLTREEYEREIKEHGMVWTGIP